MGDKTEESFRGQNRNRKERQLVGRSNQYSGFSFRMICVY